MIKHKNQTSKSHAKATFKALVEATILSTSEFDKRQETVRSYKLDYLRMYEYHIWALDNSFSINIFKMNFKIRLSNQTAKMLDIAAKYLIDSGRNGEPINSYMLNKKLVFASLAPSDRFRVLELLEEQKINLKKLPFPFWNNYSFVSSIIHNISTLNTIGYYSGQLEGFSTDIDSKFQKLPLSWEEIGYPGRSMGYHALRGYLIEKFTK